MSRPAARLPWPPIPVRLNQPLVTGKVPSAVAEHGQEPRYRERRSRIRYSTAAIADLGAAVIRIPATAITSMIRHSAVSMPILGPGVSRAGAEYGQHGRAEHDDLGHRADDVARDHQPSGDEAQVRVDRAAHPLERGTAVRAPQVQPAVANWR